VLLLVFNRSAVVRQLLSAIRPHRPGRVYVAADGPRAAYRREPVPLRRTLAAKIASAHAGRKWTWSCAWYWSMLQHRARSVIPAVNPIRNIGDGDDATHQHGAAHPLRRTPGASLAWPLIHPTAVVTDPRYDALLTRYHHGSVRRRLSDAWWTVREAFA